MQVVQQIVRWDCVSAHCRPRQQVGEVDAGRVWVFGVKSVDCPMSLLDEEVLGEERSIYAAGVAVRVA